MKIALHYTAASFFSPPTSLRWPHVVSLRTRTVLRTASLVFGAKYLKSAPEGVSALGGAPVATQPARNKEPAMLMIFLMMPHNNLNTLEALW